MNKKMIALVDMDGTITDYDSIIVKEMDKMRHPKEPPYIHNGPSTKYPPYLRDRLESIRNRPNWWLNLPTISGGMEIVINLSDIGYKIVILTKAPSRSPNAYTEKYLWCVKYLGKVSVMVTTGEKELVRGDVLIDDNVDYVEKWAIENPRSMVLIPKHQWNADYVPNRETHPNNRFVHYDNNELGIQQASKAAIEFYNERMHNTK